MKKNYWMVLGLLIVSLLSSCAGMPVPVTGAVGVSSAAAPLMINPVPTPAPASDTPEDYNPLTGLPVNNPDNLLVPPALVSVTNWPPSARPQAGLSFSPIVFELYIGEGMSRFLAMFYGDFPTTVSEEEGNSKVGANSGSPTVQGAEAAVGPIRSGRLPYESLRSIYNGFLVMASAYRGVAANLSQHSNVFGSDSDDINSALIPVDKLEGIAQSTKKQLGEAALSGMVFDDTAPQGGQTVDRFWFIYNAIDMILWQYDPDIESFRRYQDQADGKTFNQFTDRLNGDSLTYENIILLYANHRGCTESAFDIDLMYINRAPAVLLRDGKAYNIYWSTANGEYERTTGKLRPIRFIDANGEPFPLKPGQTWVYLLPTGTPTWEAPDKEEIPVNTPQWVAPNAQALLYNLLNNKEPGSGNWVSRYYASMIPYDKAVCDKIKK